MTVRFLVMCILLAGSFAHADKAIKAKPPSVVGRVVGIEIVDDAVILTVAAGMNEGVTKGARVRFREGKTTKLLAGGEAVLIRVDRRTSILKTKLPAAQVRANRFVQFDP
jgi:hypothetical protein